MQAFDKTIKITKQDDQYTISVAISDNTIITKAITKNSLNQLFIEMKELLKD